MIAFSSGLRFPLGHLYLLEKNYQFLKKNSIHKNLDLVNFAVGLILLTESNLLQTKIYVNKKLLLTEAINQKYFLPDLLELDIL